MISVPRSQRADLPLWYFFQDKYLRIAEHFSGTFSISSRNKLLKNKPFNICLVLFLAQHGDKDHDGSK